MVAVLHTEFGEHAVQVPVDGAHRQAQLAGDLAVAHPDTDKIGDLPLRSVSGSWSPALHMAGVSAPLWPDSHSARAADSNSPPRQPARAYSPGRVGSCIGGQPRRTDHLEPVRGRDELTGVLAGQAAAACAATGLGQPATLAARQLLDPAVTRGFPNRNAGAGP